MRVALDFVVRTAIWAAVLGLWMRLHRLPSRSAWPEASEISTVLGLALVVGGSALYVAAALALARASRDGRGTPLKLLTGGPYGYVRNPVYLGIAVVAVGFMCVYQLWRVRDLLATGLLLLFGHFMVVWLEEPAAARRFGQSYEAYRRRVPRWLPRPRFRPE